jgi:glyceraldehyde 3-phosphate dehydrogenase
MNIAINGFGRIGKSFLRVLLADPEAQKHLNVVAINIGYGAPEQIDYVVRYDTTMGTYHGDMSYENGVLSVGDYRIHVSAQPDFDMLNWRELDVDWVVDCTGAATKRDVAQKHLDAGAKKLLISAPAEGADVSIIPGVNDVDYNPEKDNIVSLGSCTTNALVPLIKILSDSVGIEQAYMTTLHAYTNSQALLDETSGRDDKRRSRAAAMNAIPTSTGASDMVGKIFPDIGKRVQAMAVRIPVNIASLVDLTVIPEKNMSTEALNGYIAEIADTSMRGIVGITYDECVSSDFVGNPHSITIDGLLTSSHQSMIKVFGWYDNEWGYSSRMKDFLLQCCI